MADKLKVLFITYTHSGGGGGEAVLTTLVNHLPKSWHIDILETIDYSVKKEPINENVNLLHPLTDASSKMINRIMHYIFINHPKIIKTLRRLDGYDVVIGWVFINSFHMLPAFSESKKIIWFHAMVDDLLSDSLCGTAEYYNRLNNLSFEKKACACSDNLVVISNKVKESVLQVYSEYSNKLKIIYNPVDIDEIIKQSNKTMQDNFYNSLFTKLVATKLPILVSIGRLDSNKNYSLALNALYVLKQKNIFSYYILIGNGNEQAKLENLVDELHLKDRVFFMGFQQNPLPILKSCKLLLFTSLQEGFGMVVAEAMVLGIPFVTTPVAGASDELSDGENCGLVSDWDAEEYAQKVELLLKDEELYKRMSKNCKEHIRNFSVESSLNSFYKMLEEIPKKSVKPKKTNRNVALVLCVLYATWGYVTTTAKTARVRLNIFMSKLCLLNLLKLVYRCSVFAFSLLSSPLFVIYVSFLLVNNKKRLFG